MATDSWALRSTPPALLAVSHGTSSPVGASAVHALAGALRERRPDLDVHEAYVDVQQPDVATALASLAEDRGSVVVPLLLSAGYHVHVDLQRAVRGRAQTVLTGALGPDPRLVDVLVTRLAESWGVTGASSVEREEYVAAAVRGALGRRGSIVLAAAGSSDDRAVRDCHAVAAMLGDRLGVRARAAFLSAAAPSLPSVVAEAHQDRVFPVVVVTYLLAPGWFADQVMRSGADVVTAPLLAPGHAVPSALVDVVLDRFEHGISQWRPFRSPEQNGRRPGVEGRPTGPDD